MAIKLEKQQERELAAGRAKLLKCAKCGKVSYYGAMNLIAQAIHGHVPACSFKCNVALGQTDERNKP